MTTDTLEDVALADLVVDINVRTDIKLDKSFVSSIRNHGILQPPIGWRGDDGKVRITAGQRRTLAAMEIGLEQIPVIIKPQEIAEAARIVTQLTENDQRQELSDSERVFGYKQLAMFGVSADQIARKTNKPRAHVDQALKVASSELAEDAIASYPIGLEQAAALVEFEDDPAAVERLLEVAGTSPRSFDHEAQRIRDQRAYERAKADYETELAAKGWEILEERPIWSDETIKAIGSLWRVDDETKTTLDEPENTAGLTGRVVYVGRSGFGSDSPVAATFYIRGWADQGLTTWNSGTTAKPELTDAEKAERKKNRALAADLKSATIVRRDWIKNTLLTAPKNIHVPDALELLTAEILATAPSASDQRTYELVVELLDLSVDPKHDKWMTPGRLALIATRDTRDPIINALAVAIARADAALGDAKYATQIVETPTEGYAEYLKDLQNLGYTLADVEQHIVDVVAREKGKK